MARRKRFSTVRRYARRASRGYRRAYKKYNEGSLSLKNIALVGVGMGLGPSAGGMVRKYVPMANSLPVVMGIDTCQLGTGYLAYKFGNKVPVIGKFLKPIGAGMMAGTIGNGVHSTVSGFLGGTSSGTTALY